MGAILAASLAAPAGASAQSPLQRWVSSWGPHLKGVVADEASVILALKTSPSAAPGRQCAALTADTSYMLVQPGKIPNKAIDKGLHSIMLKLNNASIDCETTADGSRVVSLKQTDRILTSQFEALGRLAGLFKKAGAPVNGKRLRTAHTNPFNPNTTSTTAVPKPHVGDELSTAQVSVTLQQVIDPAHSDNQFEIPDAGSRFVAVKVQVQNLGSTNIEDNANLDFTLIGNNGQIYSATFQSIAGCTNFQNGTYGLTPIASAVGCVNFTVPTSVAITKVEYSSNATGSKAEWAVP